MITVEDGLTGATTKFTKAYESGRKVSVIMENSEMIGTSEEMREKFKADWKGTVRQFDLMVEAE